MFFRLDRHRANRSATHGNREIAYIHHFRWPGWLGFGLRLFGRGGNDAVNGGPGNDLIDGGPDRDLLSGSDDRDRFDFNSIAETKVGATVRDVIIDFSHAEADVIDLSTIDADQRAGQAGNQKFVFIGSDSFAHFHAVHPGVFGMVRFAFGVVQGNVNAALGADFEIEVNGATLLAAADFAL